MLSKCIRAASLFTCVMALITVPASAQDTPPPDLENEPRIDGFPASMQPWRNVDDPLTMYLSDIFTISANLAGIPGISVPCGFSSSGLPIGLQLLGKHFDEAGLFKAAYSFEQATEHHKRKPNL